MFFASRQLAERLPAFYLAGSSQLGFSSPLGWPVKCDIKVGIDGIMCDRLATECH